MGDTWSTNLTDFLDSAGRIPDLPVPALNLVNHLGAIVVFVTSRSRPAIGRSDVQCRRRPGRRRCTGRIVAAIERDTTIVWGCPVCQDQGVIRKWQGTLWDCRRRGSTH